MLLIIKDGKFMILTRQNPKGGPALKGYPLAEDPETGMLGHKVGYCPHGEPLLIRTVDARDIANKFGASLYEYERWYTKLKPKTPLREKIIKLLGGKVG